MIMLLIALLLSTGDADFIYEPGTAVEDTTEITGRFAGFSMGDYYHAVFIQENGSMETAWAPTFRNPGLDVFLSLHRGDTLTVLVVNVTTILYEAGEQIIPTVMDATAGEESYNEWLQMVTAEHGELTQQEFYNLFGDPFTDWDTVNEMDFQGRM